MFFPWDYNNDKTVTLLLAGDNRLTIRYECITSLVFCQEIIARP